MLTELQKRIDNGKMILISEIRPPQSGEPATLESITQKMMGNVCALGLSDNKDEICMSSMAASAIVKNAGVEPIMHMITRDKNRIALISDFLGAQSLGIHNLLLTSGTHQSLGKYKEAKNVFDIDSIQFIEIISRLSENGNILGEKKPAGINSFCLGAAADPFADPLQMQIIKLEKKINAGARFIITKPVFSTSRFKQWWDEVTAKGLHKKAAIIAGIKILSSADELNQLAESRPDPVIPENIIKQINSKKESKSMKEEGIKIALETIDELLKIKGLRGFEINSHGDYSSVLRVIKESKLDEKGMEKK